MRQNMSTLWLSVLLFISSVNLALTRECPCSSPDLCKTITAVHKREYFVFDVEPKVWKKYDWSRITTIAVDRDWDDELMCYAHSKGVRVVIMGDLPSISELTNSTARDEWIITHTMSALENFADGINFDIEGVVADNSTEQKMLTELVQLTTQSFKSNIPGSQVTFDTPYAPHCTWGRCYDYKAIADTIDFLVIMDYDMGEQTAPCIANSNSPYNKIVQGVEEFMKIDVSPDKLVIAVPWYGYDYLCTHINTTNDTCYVGCGSKDTHSLSYSEAQDLLVSRTDTGRKWHKPSLSPYFFYSDQYGNIRQVWYDDPSSLSLKYKYALETAKIRGIGMWTGDMLDYGGLKRGTMQTKQMWDTFSNTGRWNQESEDDNVIRFH